MIDCKTRIDFLEKTIAKLKKENMYLKQTIRNYKYDDLTGFLRRSDFNDRFDELWYEWENFNHRFVICMIDINGLHEINRTISYEAGDEFIIKISGQLKLLFEDSNIFRIGGDEFMLLKRGNDIDNFINRLEQIENIEFHAIGCYENNNSYSQGELFQILDDEIIRKKKVNRCIVNEGNCSPEDCECGKISRSNPKPGIKNTNLEIPCEIKEDGRCENKICPSEICVKKT